MSKITNMLALVAVAGLGAYVAYDKIKQSKANEDAPAVETINWIAAATGRVEPKEGEIRLGATHLGRTEEVLVKVEDKVEEGELLVRLDDAGHAPSSPPPRLRPRLCARIVRRRLPVAARTSVRQKTPYIQPSARSPGPASSWITRFLPNATARVPSSR
ncbi:MAG: hypothetical protein WC807_10380 [Hyphomicrobium sp.]|jgi:hypothetical protein